LASLVLCLLMMAAAPLRAAEFIAEVDRSEFYINEHAVLTLSLSGSDTRLRAEGVAPNVDLTVLSPDFEFGTPRADFRFSTARARGRATSSVSVELFPRRAGVLRIPSFSVDGLSTEAITLRVLPLPADARPEAFVRSGVARDRLHVGEQTLLWLDLYYRVELAGARLGGPLESRPREFEAHALPVEERSESIDGIEYRVNRSAWAVSPTQAGELLLMLPEVRVETRQGRSWRLPFSEQRIEAIPLPPGVSDALIGRPEVTATMPEILHAGEPVAWEIELRSRSGLNRLPLAAPLADALTGVRAYMDPPQRRVELDAAGEPVSIAVYRGHLLAEHEGVTASPALAQAYFEPATASMRVLEVAGTPLRVEPSTMPRDAVPVTAQTTVTSARDSSDDSEFWRMTTIALAIAWLMTLAAWGWTRRRGHAGARPSSSAASDPLQRLLDALGARTLEEGLERRERQHGTDAALHAAVRRVQRIRYRPDDLPQDRREAELHAAIEAALALLGGREADIPTRTREEEDPWSPRAFSTPRNASDTTRP
jgi:hypothetical protein